VFKGAWGHCPQQAVCGEMDSHKHCLPLLSPPVSGILDNRFYLYLLGLADEHIASVGIKNYFSKVDLCLILQIVRQKYLTSSFVHSILKYS